MLRLYNTLSRSLETFSPLRNGQIRMYVCGLTPSGEPHLGHARSFLFFDVFRRYLRHLGYKVTYVQNVTDIDDRSIEASRQEGRPWHEIIERYYSSFKRSMRRLGVAEPDFEPRATEYIPQILAMIEKLVETGHAYASEDGVYFRVASFPAYGKLSGENLDELMIGARIRENEKKQNPLDFALWKFEKPGEPSWPRNLVRAARAGTSSARRWRTTARRAVRYSRRRRGSDFSASRKRDRAKRIVAPADADGEFLGARRTTVIRAAQDVKVARELRAAL